MGSPYCKMRAGIFMWVAALSWCAANAFPQEGSGDGVTAGPSAAGYTKAPDTCDKEISRLHRLIAGTDKQTEQERYFQELMDVYDTQMEHLDTLDVLTTGTRRTEGKVLGEKAHDYILYAGNLLDKDKAYRMLRKAVALESPTPGIQVLQDLVSVSLMRLRADTTFTRQFLQDYLTAVSNLSEIRKTVSSPDSMQQIRLAENEINSLFIESGTAGCERLQAIFGPEIESHRHDLTYLNQVLSIMRQLRCTGENVYYEAAEAAHAIHPTAMTALGCAYKYHKEGDTEKSLRYFDEAVSLEPDVRKKAEFSFSAAVTLYRKRLWGKAREYADKALAYDTTLGKAYILIAQMYASNPNWSDETTLNKCTYYAAIDKLMRAKEVDPDMAEEAQKLITTYAAMTPKDEDLFFLGLKKGNPVHIGGWIKETTTIK